ncbi:MULTISPECIES: hypothetical protein [unclassified Bradyrhizobium]|uniref:hypothetical protein n=1 Tax=unclassified Bradyrhizobium TaxID=2631580 RepID=UPI0028E99AF3|nr:MULTISPECIES: hypothetical protein [unclassified Bradyrhizobium]
MTDYQHVCGNTECPYLSQPTGSWCRCHKTKEQMMGERISALTTRAADMEMVFIDICDELGCKYDNEAALQAIADLRTQVEQQVREKQDAFDLGFRAAGGEIYDVSPLLLPKLSSECPSCGDTDKHTSGCAA